LRDSRERDQRHCERGDGNMRPRDFHDFPPSKAQGRNSADAEFERPSVDAKY
jgi:hypothetical protein